MKNLRPWTKRIPPRAGVAVLFACLALSTTMFTPSRASASGDSPAVRADQGAWDRILKQFVDDEGMVAYRRISTEGRPELDNYLAWVATTDPAAMTPQDQLAFWINAYNAGIVDAVLRDYSPESALSRARLFRWYSFPAAGKNRTPDDIEQQILRKQFREPRIHFALVCGATSCPKLRREAYRGDRLDQQFDDQARRFINDPARNRVDAARRTIELSSIFEWFASDFTAAAGSVAAFVARYVDSPQQATLLQAHADRTRFLEYDWRLNAQRETADQP